jgi:integrase/recombinase XerD
MPLRQRGRVTRLSEYGDVDSDFVFVNLWEGERGRRLSYATVDKLVRRTRQRVGFHFSAHMLRHTYATLAYRDGVALEVIGTVLTHRSPHSAHVYTHATVEDLRRALEERGVLDRVADLVA